MKIYFSGSINGGREKQNDYKKLIEYLNQFGTVLDEHVGKEKPIVENEIKYAEEEAEHVYIRDTKWLEECDVVIAEVSVPSLGVGYEISYAERLKKKIICLYDIYSDKKLSYMISGNKRNSIIKYSNIEDLKEKLIKLLEEK